MGSIISRVKVFKFAIKELLSMNESYERLLKRIYTSPGLPVPNPTASFWMDKPSPIATRHDKLPEHADIVIIGSGITGTSFARTLFSQLESTDRPMTMKVVMLEAREACSGATGRNGGHIKPPLHHDYKQLKEKYGAEQAAAIMRFRLSHLDELLDVAAEEDCVKYCQGREVDSLDVFFDKKMYENAKKQLQAWKIDMPIEAEDYVALDKDLAIDRFRLSTEVAGVVYNHAGAIHPYRLVTTILERLLEEHPENFHLSTQTPCTSISAPSKESQYYTVSTPRGLITTPHVVHTTNAWAANLLDPMRSKIFPVRGNMSAQRPGSNLSQSTLDGQRSWVFYDKHIGYDYLTQLPNGEHELMFGGGFFQGSDDAGLGELGITRDDEYNLGVATHISGALPLLFGAENWGAEKEPDKDKDNSKWLRGRVKALWSGIIGISADGLPWVGRVSEKVAGRKAPAIELSPAFSVSMATTIENEGTGKVINSVRQTARPGEWLAGGFSGEGMVHAFLSGKALAYMLLGMETEVQVHKWLPSVFHITEKRWKKANPEDLLERLAHTNN